MPVESIISRRVPVSKIMARPDFLHGLESALTSDFWLLIAASALIDDISTGGGKCTHRGE